MQDQTVRAVNQLRCEHAQNPIGIETPRPRLSWKLQPRRENGLRQKAYQIAVGSSLAANDLWDSGRVESDQSLFVDYAGAPLPSRSKAFWRVRFWDEADRASDWSETATFEMGLLNRDEWVGQWISGQLAGGPKSQVPQPFFRKAFDLPADDITSARLYVTALGVYDVNINGQRVGRDIFAPGWTAYDMRVQYQVYDVTKTLAAGENVIGAMLGDGWFSGYLGNRRERAYYGDRPALHAQLVITMADGSEHTIATDASWKVTYDGPILASDFFMGETYDARRELNGWSTPGYDDSAWHAARIGPQPAISIAPMRGPTVQAIETLKPKSIRRSRHHHQLVDFGQNLVGRLRLRILRPVAGKTILMHFAEILDKGQDGVIYTENLRTAKQLVTYTMRGDGAEEIYETHFTFHGFRYVELDGYPGDLSDADVTAVVLHSHMERTGNFACSEPLVNQLQSNIVWGQKGNFLDVPTDCPQRDERLGWTGDAQVFVRTAAFNFDVSGFFDKWCQDLRDAQGENGAYPAVAPRADQSTVDGGSGWGSDGGPAWADAGVICPWTIYNCYGDKQLLAEHYPSAVKFVDYLHTMAEPFDFIRSHPDWKGFHGFGDWLATDAGREIVLGLTAKELIGTAFFSHSARLLSQMAAALGNDADQHKYAALADRVAATFAKRFVTADGLIVSNTQTAYVLALHFDLLPASLRPAAVAELVRLIKNAGLHLSTGFVGTPYLLHVLSRFDRLDIAYSLLLQRSYPSWLYPVTQGATTIWERWDGWTETKGFQDAGMNSFNHYAYGAVGDWLYRVVAGLDMAEPGYKKLMLRPRPSKGLSQAKAQLETPYGMASSVWEISGGKFHWQITVPPNTTAVAHLPTAASELQPLAAGNYEFEVPWTEA